MQNKPNFQNAKMNLTFYSTKDYENKPNLRTPKNKPNQTQFYPPPAVSDYLWHFLFGICGFLY